MNLLSEHNRILRLGEGGSQEYFEGPNINITDHVISGKYWDNEINSAISSTSGDIVDSAYNKTTAWVDEQGFLTAHQNVDNLPYVQNTALEFSPQSLVSSISGSGFCAISAEGALNAETANFAYNAEHADSADSAIISESALSADYAKVADSAHTCDYASTADFAYSLANGYSGIAPIVVDNEQMIISAQSAKLGVQEPLYFVEDSESATVIGIQDSAFPEFQTTNDGKVSAINGSGLYASDFTGYIPGNWIDITGNVITVTGLDSLSSDIINQAKTEITAVDYATSANIANVANSSNSATYDSLGRKIVDTYLTAHQDWTNTIQNASGNAYNSAVNWVVDQHYLTAVTGDNTPYTHGPNIDITNHVVSGKDWTTEIQAASAYAVDQATAQIPDVTNLPYVQNTALESNGILISAISGSGLYATSAENAFNADHANEADYVLSGWEYDDDDRISAYNGSAFAGQGGGQGIEYEGVAPIVVNNVEHKISAQSAVLGVQSPLYFVEDSESATIIGFSGSTGVTGQYIPYVSESTSGRHRYITNSGIELSGHDSYLDVIYYPNTATQIYSNITYSEMMSVKWIRSSLPEPIEGVDFAWIPVNTASLSYSGFYIGQLDFDNLDGNSCISIDSANIIWYDGSGPDLQNSAVVLNKTGLQSLFNCRNTVHDNSANWGSIEYTEGSNINITNHVISGKDWGSDISAASSYALNQATANIPDVTNLTYVQNTAVGTANGSVTSISSYSIGNPQVPVSGESGIYLTKNNGTVYIGFSGATYPNSAHAVGIEVTAHSANWNSTYNTVTANSANWGDIPTKVVATSAQATGSNILYIVTGV